MFDPRLPSRANAAGRGISRRGFLRGTAAALAGTAVAGSSATMLAGCGSGGPGSGGPLKFWQFYAPGGAESPEQARWFIDTVEQWNKTHETKVVLEQIPTEQYLEGTKLQTAFTAGEGPDIFLISPGDFLRYYNGGVLQDLTPHMSAEARQDFFPDVLATRAVEGKVYALPMEVEPMAMYYSVKAFEDAKLSEGDIPQTWDQLLDIADKLRARERYGVLFDTVPGYYQNFTWYPFMWMGGGDAVAPSGGTSSFDSKGTVQALELWQTAVQSGVAPRQSLGYGANDIVANLGSGYCAMQNCGIWGISDLRDNSPEFEYGVFKLPVPPGGTYTTDLGGWAFVANAEGKDPETAAEFCVWALGSMEQDSIQRVVDWCTVAKSDMPPRKSVERQALATGAFESGAMKVFKDEIFPGGRAEPRYPPEIYKAVSDAIQACQLAGDDPAQQAALGAETINSYLQSYTGARIL